MAAVPAALGAGLPMVPPQAVIVAGAGAAGANGVYVAAKGRERAGAPIYEHADQGSAVLITREPHTSKKTGKTSHGWLLGKNGVPLYGVRTESLVIPGSGWKKFNGEEPLPSCQAHSRFADAYFALADEAWSVGEEAADRESWQVASEAYDRGLLALGRSGEREGLEFERRAVLLLVGRASMGAMLQDLPAALRDAAAALELSRGLRRAESIAVAALVELGCRNKVAALRLLQDPARGRILDPSRPLALGGAEEWARQAVEAARAGGPAVEDEEEEGDDSPQAHGPGPRASLKWLLDCEKAIEDDQASSAAAAREERLAGYCGGGSEKAPGKPRHLQLRLRDQKGKEISFRHSAVKPMRSWMESYAKCWGLEDSQVRFLAQGLFQLGPEDTAEGLGLGDSVLVDVVVAATPAAGGVA